MRIIHEICRKAIHYNTIKGESNTRDDKKKQIQMTEMSTF